MNTITQDMRYRLSLIQYADKFGITNAAIKIKPTASTFTDGNVVMMAPLSLSGTVPANHIIIPTSILRMKSSSFWICADVIRMPVWSCSGLNSCGVGIHALYRAYTAFSANRELWRSTHPIQNMLRSLMSRCSIPSSVSRSM